MTKQLLPADSIIGLSLQHLLDEFLTHLRYLVDAPREIDILFLYFEFEFRDVLSIEWRLSEEHPIVTDS